MKRNIRISYSVDLNVKHYLLAISELMKDDEKRELPKINAVKREIQDMFKIHGTAWVSENLNKQFKFTELEEMKIKQLLKKQNLS